MVPSKWFRLGWWQTPKSPGTSFIVATHVTNVYRVVEAVVQLYTARKFAEQADLHNYRSARGNKVQFFIPSFLVRLMPRIPLNTVWLQTHLEGSNYIDVETNSCLAVAL